MAAQQQERVAEQLAAEQRRAERPQGDAVAQLLREAMLAGGAAPMSAYLEQLQVSLEEGAGGDGGAVAGPAAVVAALEALLGGQGVLQGLLDGMVPAASGEGWVRGTLAGRLGRVLLGCFLAAWWRLAHPCCFDACACVPADEEEPVDDEVGEEEEAEAEADGGGLAPLHSSYETLSEEEEEEEDDEDFTEEESDEEEEEGEEEGLPALQVGRHVCCRCLHLVRWPPGITLPAAKHCAWRQTR